MPQRRKKHMVAMAHQPTWLLMEVGYVCLAHPRYHRRKRKTARARNHVEHEQPRKSQDRGRDGIRTHLQRRGCTTAQQTRVQGIAEETAGVWRGEWCEKSWQTRGRTVPPPAPPPGAGWGEAEAGRTMMREYRLGARGSLAAPAARHTREVRGGEIPKLCVPQELCRARAQCMKSDRWLLTDLNAA